MEGNARGSREEQRGLRGLRQPAPLTLLPIVAAGFGALMFLPFGTIGLVGSVASLLALVAFAPVNAALLRLRFTCQAEERPFRVPLDLGRVPVLAALGLLVVVLLMTQFEVRAYGIAAAALALAFVVQAVPWASTADGGQRERE